MKPKHLSNLIKEFCTENGYSEEIQDLLDFYYTHLRKSLVAKRHHTLHVAGLGQFVINRKKLGKEILKARLYLNSLDKKDYKGFERYNDVEERLRKLTELNTSIQNDVSTRKAFRETQNDRKDQKNLEQ